MLVLNELKVQREVIKIRNITKTCNVHSIIGILQYRYIPRCINRHAIYARCFYQYIVIHRVVLNRYISL